MTSPIADPIYEPPIYSSEMAKINSAKQVFLFNPKNQPFIDGKSRKVYFEHGYYFLLVCALLIGLSILILHVQLFIRDRKLDAQGQFVQGAVTSRTTHSSKNSVEYIIGYTFSVNNYLYSGYFDADLNTYSKQSIGESITVQYLPDNPTIARVNDLIDPGSSDSIDLRNLILSTLFFVGLASLLATLILGRRRLVKRGHIIAGSVIKAKHNKSKNGYTLSVHYNFASPKTGQLISSHESSVNHQLILDEIQLRAKESLCKPGTSVKILYLNDRMYRAL